MASDRVKILDVILFALVYSYMRLVDVKLDNTNVKAVKKSRKSGDLKEDKHVLKSSLQERTLHSLQKYKTAFLQPRGKAHLYWSRGRRNLGVDRAQVPPPRSPHSRSQVVDDFKRLTS